MIAMPFVVSAIAGAFASAAATGLAPSDPRNAAMPIRSPVRRQHYRMTPSTVGEDLSQRFRSGLEEIVRARGYSRQVPIVVTTSDKHYSSFVAPWAKRLKELDLGQQLIVTFDEETSKEVVRAGLPAIDSTGRPGNGPRPGDENSLLLQRDGWNRPLPQNLPTIKFLVPWQLLEMNFSSVIFSEMDVFWFTNPFVSTLKPNALISPGCQVADASAAQPAAFDIVGMDATFECMNIGFLQFRGEKIKNAMGGFVRDWLAKNKMSRNGNVGADQVVFNQFLVKANLSIGLLPKGKFAHRVDHVTANSEMAHLSFANPACKYNILDKLYNTTNPTASLLVDTYQAHRAMRKPGERNSLKESWEMC